MIIECEQVETFYDQDNIIVRRSTRMDVAILADHMKEADKDEIWASHHCTPSMGLEKGIEKSIICLTVEKEMMPICMFGISTENILGNEACIWMLSSDALEGISTRFLKNSRKFIEMFLEYYPILCNWVDVRNKKTIEWLKFCGAKFDDPAPFGVEGLMFQKFTFERGVPCA